MAKIGIYTRLSKDDGSSTSIERQEHECREFADRQGMKVVEVYRDSDLSGYDPNIVRPEFDRMMDDLAAGRIEGVVVWKMDRLTRQPGQFETFRLALATIGAQLHSVQDPFDMDTPDGLLMARLGTILAARESQTTSIRIKAQKREAARKGLPKGGPRPFGYAEDHITVVPEEAALIREATARVIRGDSLRSICLDWRDRGVKTSTGKDEFGSGGLRKILTSWRNAGIREYLGEPVAKAVWEPIISEEELEQVRAYLLRKRGPYVSRTFLLKGLIHCGKCGHPMQGSHKSTGVIRYQCQRQANTKACGGSSVLARYLEPWVWTQYCERKVRPKAKPTGNVHALIAAVFAAEDDLEHLQSDYYVHRLIDRDRYLRLLRDVEDRLADAKAEANAALETSAPTDLEPGETLETAWDTRPVHWKARRLQSAIERIYVNEGKRGQWDPGRFEIQWK